MNLFNLVVPARCLLCGLVRTYAVVETWPRRDPLCPACRRGLEPPVHENRCTVCSVPLPMYVATCERCRREEFGFSRAHSVYRHAGLAAYLVQGYKFRGHRRLANVIASFVAPSALKLLRTGMAIVPVPSGRRSVRRRGFAATRLIAEQLASATGAPFVPMLRMRSRTTQKTLGYAARRENVARAVTVARRGRVATPRDVLLVDDVFTTGATADACAAALRSAGTEHVVVLTVTSEY